MTAMTASETITVSGTDKLEISKTANLKMPVKMEKLQLTEKTSKDSNSLDDPNLPGPSHRIIHPRILRQPTLNRVIPLDQIDGILSLLLDRFPNVNHAPRTGHRHDAATIMYERPVLDRNP